MSAFTLIPGCEMMVTGGDNGTIRLWNTATSNSTAQPAHSNMVSSLVCGKSARGGIVVVSGSYDGRVGVWEMVIGRDGVDHLHLMQMLGEVDSAEVLCVQYVNGRVFAGGNGNVVDVWDPDKSGVITIDELQKIIRRGTATSSTDVRTAVAFQPPQKGSISVAASARAGN